MGFKEWIIPQDRAFYDLLERHIAISGETVAEFRSMQANWTNVEAWRSKIKELENEADAVGHETFDRLNRTFITPIDREDIARLAHAIDDIADAVYAATNRIALYGIPGPTAPMKEFTDILEAQVKELAAAMTKLRKSGSMAKTVPPHVVEVHRLENLADRALNRA